jgi:hypothetical protein
VNGDRNPCEIKGCPYLVFEIAKVGRWESGGIIAEGHENGWFGAGLGKVIEPNGASPVEGRGMTLEGCLKEAIEITSSDSLPVGDSHLLNVSKKAGDLFSG